MVIFITFTSLLPINELQQLWAVIKLILTQTYSLKQTMMTKSIPRHFPPQTKNNQNKELANITQNNFSNMGISLKLSDTSSFEWALEQTSPSTQLIKDTRIKSQPKNYIQKNKKKLFNFYKDRIPPQELAIFREQEKGMSPSKLIEIKKEQNEKKMNTCMSLKQSYQTEKYPVSLSINKLDKTFVSSTKNNPKNKMAIIAQMNRIQSTTIHRKATQSSFMKRSQTTKKQAFIQVFGDDAYLKHRKMRPANVKPSQTKIFKENPKVILQKKQQEKNKKDRAQFSTLLGKLTEYSEQYNPFFRKPESKQKNKVHTEQETNPQNDDKSDEDKNEMITWIKRITFDYQQKNMKIDNKMPEGNASNVGDIKKLKHFNSKFYKEMKEHKNGRLKIRQQAIAQKVQVYSLYLPSALGIEKKKEFNESEMGEQDPYQKQNLTMLLTITDRGLETLDPTRQTPIRKLKQKCPLFIKMKNFVYNLIKSIYDCQIMGIDRALIYSVLWKQKKPFDIEGSYTFFKYVKNGDVEALKKFIKKNKSFVYQIDSQGRSPLIYAAQNRQSGVVEFLLSLGINVEEKAYNKRTALYYALKGNDYISVKALLQYGASPWSTKQNTYSDLLQTANLQILTAMKNARRIHIAVNLLRKKSQRISRWKSLHGQITGQQQIKFQ